jgi:hypothetical protein
MLIREHCHFRFPADQLARPSFETPNMLDYLIWIDDSLLNGVLLFVLFHVDLICYFFWIIFGWS